MALNCALVNGAPSSIVSHRAFVITSDSHSASKGEPQERHLCDRKVKNARAASWASPVRSQPRADRQRIPPFNLLIQIIFIRFNWAPS
jgi:hypothetical protein